MPDATLHSAPSTDPITETPVGRWEIPGDDEVIYGHDYRLIIAVESVQRVGKLGGVGVEEGRIRADDDPPLSPARCSRG